MNNLKQQWTDVVSATSGIDLTFLILRLLSLLGGAFWFMAAPLTPAEKSVLAKGLIYFLSYSTACYVLIFLKPAFLRKIYLSSLFFDLIFISYLVQSISSFENSFFLGYYLLVSLHTLYFGLSFGITVAVLSTIAYLVSITPLLYGINWTDLITRIVFLYFIVVPLGLLYEKLKKDKQTQEHLYAKLADFLESYKSIQQKLVEAEKFSALGRMTGEIAHEIRNPLTAVGGFARRLNTSLAKGTKEKKYAEIIISEVNRLEKILVDTLVYGKAVNFDLTRESLSTPATQAAAFYRDVISDQGIIIEEKYDSEQPKAKIDVQQIQQVMNCLISNGIDAMTNGSGVVTLRSGQEQRNGVTYLTMTVSDTGPGISEECQEYIFEPFFSTKKIGQGTGLGLSIVRKIMDEHRGFIEVENTPGQGAAFTLFFPYQSEEQDAMEPCWKALKCGIEQDNSRRCPSYPYFGRICWVTAGSCSQKISGICAKKLNDCRQCEFYQQVNEVVPQEVV